MSSEDDGGWGCMRYEDDELSDMWLDAPKSKIDKEDYIPESLV